jgi:hypothetical protein
MLSDAMIPALECLKLHFYLESSIKTNVKNNRYEVHIRNIPSLS